MRMRDFVLMTDSCCDMTAEMEKDLEISVLPLTLQMGENAYRNWLDGREIGFHEFYERIRGGETALTSAVSVGDFEDRMREILDAGKDILCINFSSALSGTYQSAVIAAEDLQEEYPEAKIYVVDSLSASLGQGMLLSLCARQKREGKTIEEVRDYAEETKGKIAHWFTVDDLNYLKRGGRISAATAALGTVLSIKPILKVDETGHLISAGKARGRKAALKALVDRMEETAVNPGEQTVFISHGDCEEDALFVADEIRRRFGTKEICINYVGPVIGNHTGPGVVALLFLAESR